MLFCVVVCTPGATKDKNVDVLTDNGPDKIIQQTEIISMD